MPYQKIGCYYYSMIELIVSLKNHPRLMFIALALCFSVDSNATEIVVGSVSCQEWIKDRSDNSDYSNKNVDESWILAFLNGYSVATRIKFLSNVKSEYVLNWMDRFCAIHQQDKINDGVLILAHQLIQQMKKNAPKEN